MGISFEDDEFDLHFRNPNYFLDTLPILSRISRTASKYVDLHPQLCHSVTMPMRNDTCSRGDLIHWSANPELSFEMVT